MPVGKLNYENREFCLGFDARQTAPMCCMKKGRILDIHDISSNWGGVADFIHHHKWHTTFLSFFSTHQYAPVTLSRCEGVLKKSNVFHETGFRCADSRTMNFSDRNFAQPA